MDMALQQVVENMRQRVLDRRPLLKPMRVTSNIQIAVTGAITVNVTADKHKAYTPTPNINVALNWSAWLLPGPFQLHIDFGDGRVFDDVVVSKGFNFPSLNYATAGDYTISATVTDIVSLATGSGSDMVSVKNPVTVGLSANPSSGDIPLAVTFSSPIAGGFRPFSCSLDFGDGTTPDTFNAPAEGMVVWAPHTYNKIGSYTATVTVTDSLGTALSAQAFIGAGELRFPKLRAAFPKIFELIDRLKPSPITYPPY